MDGQMDRRTDNANSRVAFATENLKTQGSQIIKEVSKRKPFFHQNQNPKLRFMFTIFQELWGHGSEPADNYCYQNYNQLGTANGNCGQFSKYKYGGEMEFKKCSQR